MFVVVVVLGEAGRADIPDGERQHRPGHPWLEGAVADAQQQRGGMVEAPLVGAAQIAVLDLVGQQVEGIKAVEQGSSRCRRRRGLCSGSDADRHGYVIAAALLGRGEGGGVVCICMCERGRRVACIFRVPWSFGLAVDGTRSGRCSHRQSESESEYTYGPAASPRPRPRPRPRP